MYYLFLMVSTNSKPHWIIEPINLQCPIDINLLVHQIHDNKQEQVLAFNYSITNKIRDNCFKLRNHLRT